MLHADIDFYYFPALLYIFAAAGGFKLFMPYDAFIMQNTPLYIYISLL